MVVIKDAAVPHYSKYNGKVVFAVRVCPANNSIEPYTVYRRWDEFLDLSSKLANVFPSASPDPNDPSTIFRRIPRLSRKVILFATSSTHSNRKDELDLFVRHLVNLPKAVTSFPLVRDFFNIKMNGLDGRQPPSPTISPSPTQSSQFDTFVANQTRSEVFLQNSVLTVRNGKQPEQHMQQQQQQPQAQVLKKKGSKLMLQQSPRTDENIMQARPFRPTLAAKRSTPDLRRFISSSSKDIFASSSEEELPLPPVPKSQYPTLDKFSFPPRRAPNCPPSSRTPGPLVSASPSTPQTSRPSTRGSYVSSMAISCPLSPASDTASMYTNSTVRPGRAGSTSRMASPMSFVSVTTSDDSGRSTPMPSLASPAIITRPSGGSKTSNGPALSLRHFRSLQDIRNVLAPHPHLPMLDTSVQPTYACASGTSSATSTPPQTPLSASGASFVSPKTSQAASQGMTRSRSDSKILLMATLPSLVEDEVVSPTSSPLTRTPSTGSRHRSSSTAPGMARSFSADSVTPGSYPVRRPSLNSVRRMQHNLAMTPTSQHQASSSISSIASTDSGSSMSLSRSQISNSSAGLGLDFSSSSRESFDFSDNSSSTLNSPDSSLIIHSPITPVSASAMDKLDPFDKLFHQQQNDLLHNGLYGGSYMGHNTPPPLPFFPTPAAYDQMQQLSAQSRRNSAANRRRASSLHQPVLETILGSPVMGSELKELPPMINLKVRMETTNFMIKIAKSASLKDVKEKIAIKVQSSGSIILGGAFGLAVLAAASSPSSDTTAKGSSVLESKGSSLPEAVCQHVQLEDEEDWKLAVSLASSKITLQVTA